MDTINKLKDIELRFNRKNQKTVKVDRYLLRSAIDLLELYKESNENYFEERQKLKLFRDEHCYRNELQSYQKADEEFYDNECRRLSEEDHEKTLKNRIEEIILFDITDYEKYMLIYRMGKSDMSSENLK
jgi:hypothetical protein